MGRWPRRGIRGPCGGVRLLDAAVQLAVTWYCLKDLAYRLEPGSTRGIEAGEEMGVGVETTYGVVSFCN